METQTKTFFLFIDEKIKEFCKNYQEPKGDPISDQISFFCQTYGKTPGPVGSSISSYLSGKALLYGMWGWVPVSLWHTAWAKFYEKLPF